jgi:hypothetical protein
LSVKACCTSLYRSTLGCVWVDRRGAATFADFFVAVPVLLLVVEVLEVDVLAVDDVLAEDFLAADFFLAAAADLLGVGSAAKTAKPAHSARTTAIIFVPKISF